MAPPLNSRKIHIIGLGVTEAAQLDSQARRALQTAGAVIGAARQLAIIEPLIDGLDIERFELPALGQLTPLMNGLGHSSIAVLASGDPLYYGIGRWFSRHFAARQLRFYPAVSSVQVACHRLGVALQDLDVLSLHGRPLAKIRTKLKHNKQLLILTDKHSQPSCLAQECLAAGFSASTITVLEQLGYAQEKISTWAVDALVASDQVFHELHVSYLHVLGPGGVLPEFPGIPDHHYVTGDQPGKGMISKREVRLAILSLMQVCAGDVVWDIGAGCGGVAVELALWHEHAEIYALECHAQRLEYLRKNQRHFGVVQNLHVIAGRAPKALAGLPSPHKVFIGGSDGELALLLQTVWQQLPQQGVLVVSAVMQSTRQHLQQFARQLAPEQVESLELSVKRAQWEGESLQYVPKLPIALFKFVKTAGDL